MLTELRQPDVRPVSGSERPQVRPDRVGSGREGQRGRLWSLENLPAWPLSPRALRAQ